MASVCRCRPATSRRDAAAILIGQLREIYFEPELKPVDTTNWYPKLLRKDYMVGLNVSETGVDDTDQQFYEAPLFALAALRANFVISAPRALGSSPRPNRRANPPPRRDPVCDCERPLSFQAPAPLAR